MLKPVNSWGRYLLHILNAHMLSFLLLVDLSTLKCPQIAQLVSGEIAECGAHVDFLTFEIFLLSFWFYLRCQNNLQIIFF